MVCRSEFGFVENLPCFVGARGFLLLLVRRLIYVLPESLIVNSFRDTTGISGTRIAFLIGL